MHNKKVKKVKKEKKVSPVLYVCCVVKGTPLFSWDQYPCTNVTILDIWRSILDWFGGFRKNAGDLVIHDGSGLWIRPRR